PAAAPPSPALLPYTTPFRSGRIPAQDWQFVDGVPDGPVVVPDGEERGGVLDPGPDVGLYTDIAVASDGTVLVSYFDQDATSLKLDRKSTRLNSSHVKSSYAV